jgi:hypothetical protein
MEPVTVNESIRLRVSTFEFWDNGIVYIKIDDNAEVQLEDSVDQFELLNSRFNGKTRFRVLVDPGSYTTVANDAREFSCRPETNSITAATAVIVKSLAQRIIMNFLINFMKKHDTKLRMFDSREKAIQWLLNVKV